MPTAKGLTVLQRMHNKDDGCGRERFELSGEAMRKDISSRSINVALLIDPKLRDSEVTEHSCRNGHGKPQ